MAEQLDVPVGIVSVGVADTRVDEWLPGADGPAADLYDRLSNALKMLGPNGARAVLWHQGESDALSRTPQKNYVERLTKVIDQSRTDAGYDVPWGVAKAAFIPAADVDAIAPVLAAQQEVIVGDPLVFAGPNTDDLGVEFRYDGVHFNEEGLRLHAEDWADAVLSIIVPEPTELSLLMSGGMLLGAVRRRRR